MKVATRALGILPVLMVLFFLEVTASRLVGGNDHDDEVLEIRNRGEPTDGYGLPPPYGPITAESSTEDTCE